ncbi:MltG/YceG/YrrL family protein [Marinisporobacter balticus]|uniref:YceG-like family protein n=1 Tax=Marinisporobacter balticus TaxID=2018667 RepID=A0A4V6NPC3_9FIRM|nr:endolytic transglycosylase MltG [Marinisporobacter balticus]TCO73820.1 hypothetical protein EV214_11455 [Marinisporobacter balticus]
MWEKLKDVLYEVSDILLAVVIILFMSTVITWQVTDSLAYSKEKVDSLNETTKNEVVNQETPLPINQEETDSSSDAPSITPNEQIPKEIVPKETVPVEPEPTQQPPTIIHVEIPSGTAGTGIAKILKEKGLIEDTAKFIARVEELKMASKLKSGTFDIQAGSTLDDVIYTIVGKKK